MTEKRAIWCRTPPIQVPRPQTPLTSSAGIKVLQQILTDAGFYSAKIDGRYGTLTRNAVAEVQKEMTQRGFYKGRIDGAFNKVTRESAAVFLNTRATQ